MLDAVDTDALAVAGGVRCEAGLVTLRWLDCNNAPKARRHRQTKIGEKMLGSKCGPGTIPDRLLWTNQTELRLAESQGENSDRPAFALRASARQPSLASLN
jgi:hypothetical protein